MGRDERDAIEQYYAGQEDGDIFFFYRPKGVAAASANDVKNLYMVLHPLAKDYYRVVELEGAHLPETADRTERIVGRVLKVDDKEKVIKGALDEKQTVLEGVSRVAEAAARPAAEGVYSFVEHNGAVFLVYLLEIPSIPETVQSQTGLRTEDEFLVGVYNPEFRPDTETGSAPNLSPEMRRKFGDTHLLHDDILDTIDYENITLAFYRRGQEAAREHAAAVNPMWEGFDTADIFERLQIRRERVPVETLFEGEWR